MILTDCDILEEIDAGNIILQPFDRKCLGSNSYDLHLGDTLATYEDEVLDAKKHNKVNTFEIPEEGFVLMPNELYLAATHEYTETRKNVPFIDGKSSTGMKIFMTF